MRHLPLLPALTLALVSLGFTGCKKAPNAQPEVSAVVIPEPEVPPILEAADRFGLAARLPADTPLYAGTVDLGSHLAKLKGSRYWKEVMAYAEDKAPSPATDLPTSVEDLAAFPLTEFSIALGSGSEKAFRYVLELQALYSELTYYGLVAGSSASLMTGSPKADDLVGDMLSMPGLLGRVTKLAADFEVPTIILGTKMTNGEESLESIRTMVDSSDDLRGARSSNLTTPLGETLEIREWSFDTWLTDELTDATIASLPEESREVNADAVRTLQATLAEKTVCLAFGELSGHVVVVIAPNRDSIPFVSDPEESLLARADSALLAEPVLDKELAGLVLWDGDFLKNLGQTQPSKPMLDGALSGLKSNAMFAPMVDAISEQVATFQASEAVFNKRTYDDGGAVFWWDGGLHGSTVGGASADEWVLHKDLEFEPLLNTPGLIMGTNGHDASSTAGRRYFESGMALVYAAAQQALDSGIAGETFGQMRQMIQAEVIPQIVQAYDASKTLYTKALDSESAFIVELGGKLPMIWGMTEVPKGQPMLRMAAVHQVRNRALLSQSWLRFETALSSAMTKIPSPIPLSMSQPMSSERFGVTTYHQAPLFDSPDLLPCSSVNDELFILGSSKSLNEELAFQLKEAKGAPRNQGYRFRIQFKNLRKLLQAAGDYSSEEAAATTAEASRLWAAPFGLLDVHLTEEDGRVKGQIDWSIRDLLNVD